MRRRVSLWLVVALVGTLAATTAAVVVLAANDGDGGTTPHPVMPSEGRGPWQMPAIGDDRHGSDDGRGPDLLPWLLFAIATGTSVGLLVAWSPWRRDGAPVTAGGNAPGTHGPDMTTETKPDARESEGETK